MLSAFRKLAQTASQTKVQNILNKLEAFIEAEITIPPPCPGLASTTIYRSDDNSYKDLNDFTARVESGKRFLTRLNARQLDPGERRVFDIAFASDLNQWTLA